jgi:IPT/TIG domain
MSTMSRWNKLRHVHLGLCLIIASATFAMLVPGPGAGATTPPPTWEQQSPATSPSARAAASMAYDSGAGQLVLFGGAGINSGGNGVTEDDTWAYVSVTPTVSAVSPNSGPLTGGTAITITGTGFVSGATVVIGQGSGSGAGAIAATNVVVVSSTKITAVTGGAAKAGTWSLFVITTGGTSAANLGDDFTYH